MDNADIAEHAPEKKKKKKDKVRSAWISFVGRIVAQMVGAIATVALGVMVLHRYTATDTRPWHPNAAAALGAPPPALELGHTAFAQAGPAATGQLGNTPVVIVMTPCTSAVESPAASTANLGNGVFLPR